MSLLCVCGEGCSKPISDRCQSNFFKVNIVIHFNILINVKQTMYPLCLHPIQKKMEKLIDIYLVFISLNFWIFKYLSTYKPLIGTQGHGNIVLA